MWFITSTNTDWIIMNAATLTTKKIGKISRGYGINYCDRAREEATRRNRDGRSARFIPDWQVNEILNKPEPCEALEAILKAEYELQEAV